MKKLILVLALLVFVGVPVGLLVAASLALGNAPTLTGAVSLAPATIERARALVAQHDPRTSQDGQLRTMVLTGDDIRTLATYALSKYGEGALDLRLQPREATLQLSVPVPANPFGTYLNASALIGETSGLPRVQGLRVGRLPVPDWVANTALRYAVRRASASPAEEVASDVIRSVTFGDDLLRVEYEWRADLPDRLKGLAVSPDEADRLRAYNNQIVDVADRLPRRAAFTDLLTPVMQLAKERSASGDAVTENRAAILALGFYINGKGLGAIVPDARDWTRPVPRTVLLRGRDDLPKHFMVSAMLAATADSPLANAVGLYKEVDDSRGGSGFSFTDIVADRAGTLFGQLALAPGSAGRIQAVAAVRLSEADVLPTLDGLADHMPEPEFLRRFGGVGSPAYNLVLQDIERRLTTCDLLR